MDRDAHKQIVKKSQWTMALIDLCEMTAKRLADEGADTANMARALEHVRDGAGEIHRYLERIAPTP